MTATSLGYELEKHAIAQSFFVNELNGIYIAKIELFFKTVARTNTLPVELELRPMVNGFPSAESSIPDSEIIVTASNINYSDNATVKTEFIFDEPIFLNGLRDYCFVLSSNTSGYELFASEGDSFVLESNEKRISKQQSLGSLFFSQNSKTFTPAQELDLAFRIKRAAFNKTTGTVTLKNTSVPQKLLGKDPFTVSNGSSIITINDPNHGFQPNDHVVINVGGGTVANLGSSQLNGIFKVIGTADGINTLSADSSVDFTGYKIDCGTNSVENAIGGGSSVLVEKHIPYNVIYPHLQTLTPNDTIINAGFKGTTTKNFGDDDYGHTTFGSRYAIDTAFSNIALNANSKAPDPFVVLNDRGQDSGGSSFNDGSAILQLKLTTDDSAVSPVIDLQRASLSLIGYQIDKQVSQTATGANVPINFVSEISPRGGSSASKHISNVFQLDQDAVGLKIILAANRPNKTDFEVYFRTATGDEVIEDQNFTLQQEETNNPTDEDPTIFRDYEYLPGGEGGTLPPFTKFQIKVVMRSENVARAPTFTSMRVIALST